MTAMRAMWFGTRGYEQWIKMVKPDVAMPYTRRFTSTPQLNGGISVDASDSGRMEYAFEWNGRIDEVEQISDILHGQYDTDANRGLIYFIDPSAVDRNLFPKLWASPYLCGLDAPSLTKDARPALSATPSNTFGLPARTATFSVGYTASLLTLYVPIPPGWELQFALYGPTAVSSAYQTKPEGGSATVRNVLANTAYGTGLTAINGVTGVEFSLKAGVGTLALTAGLMYLVPIGTSLFAPSRFASGKGHSGCKIDGVPGRIINTIDSEINWAQQNAHLVEVGSWL